MDVRELKATHQKAPFSLPDSIASKQMPSVGKDSVHARGHVSSHELYALTD